VLSAPVIAKLAFIQARIHAHGGRTAAPNGGIRAIIAGLRQRAGISTPI